MNDKVKQENRRALPKFFGTVLLFALLGDQLRRLLDPASVHE